MRHRRKSHSSRTYGAPEPLAFGALLIPPGMAVQCSRRSARWGVGRHLIIVVCQSERPTRQADFGGSDAAVSNNREFAGLILVGRDAVVTPFDECCAKLGKRRALQGASGNSVILRKRSWSVFPSWTSVRMAWSPDLGRNPTPPNRDLRSVPSYAPWQNRVKTLCVGPAGVSFERKADAPNC
jgi:hypothetical protein